MILLVSSPRSYLLIVQIVMKYLSILLFGFFISQFNLTAWRKEEFLLIYFIVHVEKKLLLSLFFGKCNLHCMCWCDLETLESIFSSTWLKFIFKFNECNVMPVRHQTYFLESRKSKKKFIQFCIILWTNLWSITNEESEE